jgi:hypothetical protein
VTTLSNFTTPDAPPPRRRSHTATPPSAPAPPPPDEYALLEVLREVEAARSAGELAQVGQLAMVRDRHRVAVAEAEQALLGYQQRCREGAERDRLGLGFYVSPEEVRRYESGIAAARGRLAAVEQQLAELEPAVTDDDAAVTTARAALEAHRAGAHPAERVALEAAERTELAAVVTVTQARAALATAEGDVTAAKSAYSSVNAGHRRPGVRDRGADAGGPRVHAHHRVAYDPGQGDDGPVPVPVPVPVPQPGTGTSTGTGTGTAAGYWYQWPSQSR